MDGSQKHRHSRSLSFSHPSQLQSPQFYSPSQFRVHPCFPSSTWQAGSPIGSGSHAYLAMDVPTARIFVAKCIEISQGVTTSMSWEARLLENELNILFRLLGCRHAVQLLGYDLLPAPEPPPPPPLPSPLVSNTPGPMKFQTEPRSAALAAQNGSGAVIPAAKSIMLGRSFSGRHGGFISPGSRESSLPPRQPSIVGSVGGGGGEEEEEEEEEGVEALSALPPPLPPPSCSAC